MKVQKLIQNLKGSEANKRGVALVTVLTVVSLSTILILAFFSLAQSEHRASATYSNGLQAQQIAEQAVNMVIAQIREATSGADAWASQPGALRTWNEEGQFEKAFKLYSDDEMVVDDSETNLVDTDFDDLKKGWSDSDNSEVFVDLNEPVIRGSKVYYPIVDPVARELPEWPRKIGNDDSGIEGFDFNIGLGKSKNPELEALTDLGEMKAAVQGTRSDHGVENNPLPMPVRWIYQLADGTLGIVDSGSDKKFKFNSINGSGTPSKENRIVARFAFWADDETTKLNVNTHAGGLAWDIPKAGGELDMDLGRFQPAQHEWQRYPGHPATTHLIPVIAPGVIDIVNDRDAMEMIFELIPRVVGGGSESGTRKIDPRRVEERNGLIADKNPLFPSVDEFLLRPDREPAEFPDADGNSIPEDQIQEHLERMKFFLTTVSRSPEMTLFNTPRVAMWPIYNAEKSSKEYKESHLTSFDRLIHFCSTLGVRSGDSAKPVDYIFRRENADSPTFDYEQIDRNKELYNYLDELMSADVPGYGKSFQSKYGQESQLQLLTQIFDYIRCTNLHDDSLFGELWETAMVTTNTNIHRTYTNPRNKRRNREPVIGQDLLHKGHGQVVPIKITKSSVETKGFGRFYSLLETSIHMICCADASAETLSLGGQAVSPRYPGITKYGGGWNTPPIEEPAYSHLPPLSTNVDLNYNALEGGAKTAARNTWPNWLKQFPDEHPLIAGSRPGAGGVFDPAVWNWQLCWLDPAWNPENGFNRGSVNNTDVYRLNPNEKLVQAALLFHMFTPSLGWIPINPDMVVDIKMGTQITGATDANAFQFTSTRGPVGFEEGQLGGPGVGRWSTNRRQSSWHDRHYGGVKPLSYQISAQSGGRRTPIDPGYDKEPVFDQYAWVTKPFPVLRNQNFTMTGGHITFEFKTASQADCQNSAPHDDAKELEIIQQIEVEFPDLTDVPPPFLTAGRPGHENDLGGIHPAVVPLQGWSLTHHGANPEVAPRGRMARVNGWNGRLIYPQDVVQSIGVGHGDARVVAARSRITAAEGIYEPHWLYNGQNGANPRMAHSLSLSPGWRYAGFVNNAKRQIVPDINYGGKTPVLLIGGSYSNSKDVQRYGDFDNGPGLTVDGPYINKPDEGNTHSLFNRTDPDREGSGMWDFRRDYGDFPYFVRDWVHEAGTPSYFSPNRIVNGPGMFGSMPTQVKENRPWQTLLFRPDVDGSGYQTHEGAKTPPDHLIMDLFWMPVVEPYAISEPLSTAGKVNLNYQMLPFRHIERSTALRGVFKSEFMLCIPTPSLDPSKYSRDYKVGAGRGRGYHWRDKPFNGTLQGKRLRTVILEDETLQQFHDKFEKDYEIFKAASEITTMHLVPQQVATRMGISSNRAKILTYTPEVKDMANGKYWREHALIGDNGRERPYANIYSRVTTKSNTYKVHYRAQVLKQSIRDGDDYDSWEPEIDSVVGEYRGSTIVERYIEPTDEAIPDYADGSSPFDKTSLGEFFKFRIVNPTRFAP